MWYLDVPFSQGQFVYDRTISTGVLPFDQLDPITGLIYDESKMNIWISIL